MSISFKKSNLTAKHWLHKEFLEATIDLNTLAKETAKLTDINNHTEAYHLIAQKLGYKDLEKKFKLILDLMKLEKGLPSDLANYRYSLYKDLMSLGKKDFGKDFDVVHSSL